MKADLKQFDFIEPLLKSLALEVEHNYGVEFKITSLYRENDTGVHGQIPLRGIDLSCPDKEFGIIVEAYVNRKYTYDPDRLHLMCCVFHDTGSGYHIHLQVHSNTIVNNQ